MRLRGALRALTAVDNVDNYRRQVWAWPTWATSWAGRTGGGWGWGAASLEKFQMGKRRCCHHNQRTRCLTPPWDPSLIVINACCGTWGVLRVALVSGTHTHRHTLSMPIRKWRRCLIIEWRQIDLQRFNCRSNWAKRQLHFTSLHLHCSPGWSCGKATWRVRTCPVGNTGYPGVAWLPWQMAHFWQTLPGSDCACCLIRDRNRGSIPSVAIGAGAARNCADATLVAEPMRLIVA